MKYIDIGANLISSKYNDKLDEVLKDSFDNNLESIILTGTTVNGSKYAKKIVEDHPQYKLYSTAGIHPHNAKDYNETQYDQLKELLKDPKVIAVGECGLDYNRNFSTKPKQLIAFEKQIQLAMEVNKPLFLHDREASEDFINIISEYKHNIRAVVHCFTGNKETVKKYVDMGFYIGITGWVCDEKRNKELVEAMQYIPIDRLMVETDCPFLSPLNPRELNVPKNVCHIVKKIAELLNMDENKLSEKILENTKKFFGI